MTTNAKNETQTHTPGPWRCEKALTSNLSEIRGADGSYVAYTGGYEIDRVVEDANATLIAAAPDMLAALRLADALLSARGFGLSPNGGRVAIRAAIAKATGAQS